MNDIGVGQINKTKNTIQDIYSISGPTILYEKHKEICSCSYCKSQEIGLCLPKNKGTNSWRSIRWKLNNQLHVIRWTFPKFRLKKDHK